MCGIIGYISDEGDGFEKVVEGLKKLEYRGYDSAGVAAKKGQRITVLKGEGTIDEAINSRLESSSVIGHTRWATHGEVNDTNAHPHTDCEKNISIVHNGVIKNYSELKKELSSHSFSSDTDSEIIAHIVEEELESGGTLKSAVETVKNKIEGSYAVVGLTESGKAFALRKDSPLIIGVSNEGFFFASDTTPIVEYTDRVKYLEDGDYVLVDEELSIFNEEGEASRETQQVSWDAEEASKDGFNYYMQKEIAQQPETIKKAASQPEEKIRKAVEMIEKAETVYLTGCGTSSFAASLGAKYLRDEDVRIEMEQSHELEYRKDEIGEDDLIVALSQSGETADLLSVTESVEADLLSIVNVKGSTLDRSSEVSLYLNAGPEIGVASTKAFTAQLAVLKQLKFFRDGRLDEGVDSLFKTADRIEKFLKSNQSEIEELSRYLSSMESAYFIGREKGVEIAEEAALKLKELSYIHAEAFPGGEFKHGTLALVEADTPIVGFPDLEPSDEIVTNLKEAKSRGATLIGAGSESKEFFDYFLEIPEDENAEILSVVPFQALACRTALKKQNNPDKPRNLAKSVTVK